MSRFNTDLLDAYFADYPALQKWPDLLAKSKQEAERAGADFMSLSPSEASLMVQAIALAQDPNCSSTRWIEVGSLTGFSALCLLMAVGDEGRVWALEKSPERARFMRELFADDRLQGRLQVVEGDSRETKAQLESLGPFDGLFIDGAKAEYFNDLEWAEKHVRTGGLILADNVFLSGASFKALPSTERSARFSEKQSEVMRRFLARINDSTRYRSLILPTSDGLSVSRKLF